MAISTEKKIIFGIGGITLALLVGGMVLFSKPQTSTPKVVDDTSKQLLVKDSSHQSAKDTAKIAVVEFADLQCPACKSANAIVEALKKDFPESVNFVFRHFPLASHKYGMTAALAAESAASQGKFWEMEEKLYVNQDEWAESSDPLPFFEKYAKEIGIDGEKVKNDVKNKANEQKIKEDYNDGVSLGVNSTPTFFIDGEKQLGVLSYEEFKQLIEQKLN